MAYTRENPDGTRAINSVETFVGALDGRPVLGIVDFEQFILDAEALINAEYPQVSRGALNNVRGDWYESLILLGSSQYSRIQKTKYTLVRLPNVNSFSCENLYVEEISGLVGDLRSVLHEVADVSLISSNPDFVIISSELLNIRDTLQGKVEDIEYLGGIYRDLAGHCRFEQIAGYCSVKSGLRPDRRLQIAHEGSLMKALYRHIQTRLWAIDAPGIRYYGIAGACTDADRAALKTVATHSIVDVSSVPESAVNGLFAVNSGQQLQEALDTILSAPAT